MTVSFRTAITLLAAALVQGVASRDDTVGNFTLLRCPGGGNGTGCARSEKEEVVFPADPYESPGYISDLGFRHFSVDYRAPHLLTWDKVDDEPRNMSIGLGGYQMEKGPLYLAGFVQANSLLASRSFTNVSPCTEITTERELYFTFYDLATQLLPNNDSRDATEMVLGGGTRDADLNAIGFLPLNPSFNRTFLRLSDVEGIKNFFVLSTELYGYTESIMYNRSKNLTEALNKKWRIGVGVGVGVGVPLLMGLSYFLGTRKGKKKQLNPKNASH